MDHKLSIKRSTYAFAIGTALLVATPIHASTVIYEDVDIVSSNKHKLTYTMDRFEITEAGTFQVSLMDFEFPNPFKQLGLTITDATHKYAEIWDSGSMIFDAEEGDYYLGLIYKTKHRWDMGMYGIEINQISIAVNDASDSDVSAVPLPASAPLLLSGLAGIGLFRQRRKNSTEV